MAKIADADKVRAGRLDSAWIKAVWVGRVDRSNEHLLLTTKGCIRSRVARPIPYGNQVSYHAEVQGLPWDRLGEPARPSSGRPTKDGASRTSEDNDDDRTTRSKGSSDDHLRQQTTETDVIDRCIVMDSGTARASDGADQGVLSGSRRRYFNRRTGRR